MRFVNPARVAMAYRALLCGKGHERVAILMSRVSGGRFEPSHVTLYRIAQGTAADHTALRTLGHVAFLAACAFLHARKHDMAHQVAHGHVSDLFFGAIGDEFKGSFEHIVSDFAHIARVRDAEVYIVKKVDVWLPPDRQRESR